MQQYKNKNKGTIGYRAHTHTQKKKKKIFIGFLFLRVSKRPAAQLQGFILANCIY